MSIRLSVFLPILLSLVIYIFISCFGQIDIKVCLDWHVCRYEHRELAPVSTWVEPESEGEEHKFDEVHIYGGAHLAFRSHDDLSPLTLLIDRMYGDKTGQWLT